LRGRRTGAYDHDGASGINLNDELSEASGWVLTIANGINDTGSIVGSGTFGGQSRAWLMVPHGNDQDLDGLTDVIELDLGTNVFVTDTDGDGLSDLSHLNLPGRSADDRRTPIFDSLADEGGRCRFLSALSHAFSASSCSCSL